MIWPQICATTAVNSSPSHLAMLPLQVATVSWQIGWPYQRATTVQWWPLSIEATLSNVARIFFLYYYECNFISPSHQQSPV